jgi:hypothetical protein
MRRHVDAKFLSAGASEKDSHTRVVPNDAPRRSCGRHGGERAYSAQPTAAELTTHRRARPGKNAIANHANRAVRWRRLLVSARRNERDTANAS